MNMLIETFMKTMRQEKKLLLVNVSAVLLSLLTTYITVYRIGNLDIAVGSIVLLLAFRCIFAEMLMAQELNICVILDIVLEIGNGADFYCNSMVDWGHNRSGNLSGRLFSVLVHKKE